MRSDRRYQLFITVATVCAAAVLLWMLGVALSTGQLVMINPPADEEEPAPVYDSAALPRASEPVLRPGVPETTATPRAQGTPSDPLALILPVEGVQPEELLDTYNEARSGGREHRAIDIMAPRGTPVLAAADGRILRLFHSEGGGVTLYQLGTDGRTVYYYAHLDRYADGLTEDQHVRQGEVIGYVGDTGNAVPGNYHLHFAIWTVENPEDFWEGEPINPYPLLR